MITVQNILWHKSFGFGIVTDTKTAGQDTMLSVSFSDGVERRIVSSTPSCIPIPDFFVSIVTDQLYELLLSPKDLVRGKTITLEEVTVSSSPLTFRAKTLEGRFTPVITALNSTDIRFSCTCPRDGTCCHVGSLFLYLNGVFSALKAVMPDSNNLVDLLGETKKLLRAKGNSDADNEIRSLVAELASSLSQEQFNNYLKGLSELDLGAPRFSTLFDAMAYCVDTNRMLAGAFSDKNASYYKTLYPFYSQASKLIRKINRHDCEDSNLLRFLFYNSWFPQLLTALFNFEGYEPLDEFFSVFSRIIRDDPMLFDGLKTLTTSHKMSDDWAEILHRNLTVDQLNALYSDPESSLQIPLAWLNKLPEKELLQAIENDRVFQWDYDDVAKLLKKYKKSGVDSAATLLKLYYGCKDHKQKQSVLKLLSDIPGYQLFSKYLENKEKHHYSYYFFLPNLSRMAAEPDIDLTGLDRFFTTKVSVSEGRIYDDGYNIRYTLYAPDKTEVINVEEKEDGSIVCFKDLLSQPREVNYAQAFYLSAREQYASDIQAQKNQIQAKREQRILEARRQELVRQMDRMNSSLLNRVVLSDAVKADIDFNFCSKSTSWRSNLDFSLSIRIGIRKKYVVKDTIQFLEYFKNGTTFRYGKEFEFTHLLENVAEDKRSALKLLMLLSSGYTESGSQKKYLPLSSSVLYDLISSLKGSTLLFNDVEYRVMLDDLPFKVGLNKRFELTFSGQEEGNKKYFTSNNQILVFDEAEHRVDQIRGTPEQIRLYDFVMQNGGLSVEPVLDAFREKIYSQFYPYMEIDDAIKDKLTVSELGINAYFDYNDKAISVHTVLERDGVKLFPESLSTASDQIRHNTYQTYLRSLGFEDGLLTDDARVLNFFSMDMTDLKRYCNVYLSDSIQNKKIYPFGKPSIRIQYESGIMDAFLENSDFSDEELSAILRSVRRKKSFVLLSGDRIVDLSGADAKAFEKAVSDLGLNPDKLSEKKEISVQQALKGFANEANCHIDEYLYNMVSDIRNFKKSSAPVPAVSAVLRPYQEEGYKWLSTLSDYHVGGILADDMGLGKTLEIITRLKADPTEQPNLIVCPKSLVFNWVNEFRKFDPEAEVVEIYGLPSVRKKTVTAIDPHKKITYITSYDSLRNDLDDYKVTFNNVVLDEAQYIKNVDAQKSKSVKALKAAHKFALTGTPVENNIVDLWSIFDFIMPGYFGDLTSFKSDYSHDSEFTKQVARQIAPFVLRRTKGDVLKDLPEKYERLVSVEMTPDQRKLYDAYRKEAQDRLAEGAKAFDILPYLMRLRQVCDDPAMIVEGYNGGSGKLKLLSELIDEYLSNHHKILIFSQFVKGLAQVEELLAGKGIPYYKITGETPSKERIALMDSFNSSNSPGVFLISLKAGGTGLNLTGADTVIHLDPWWNVAAENQASDRAHRIGQTKNVEVIKLICEKSVEERVIELQNIKKDLIDQLISNSDKSVTSVSLEDIAYILK